MSTHSKYRAETPWLGPEEDHDSTGRGREPVLDIDQIQGNIFPGFSKDHLSLLFLKITDAYAFKHWLASIVPFIATMQEVLTFNCLFKAVTSRRQTECNTLKATWINIAFSYEGIKILKDVGTSYSLSFRDEAFTEGLHKRSKDGRLGDPVDTGLEGDPINWVVGGRDNEAHLVIIIASDVSEDLFSEVARVERTIYSFTDQDGKLRPSGAAIIFKQHCGALPGALRCHEHFGFLDSISQPGIRGKISNRSFLTPGQNPYNIDQGKPGQDLVWPGEFVFGYPGQDRNKHFPEPGLDPLKNPSRRAPAWARNGSFLVVRRLRQYVGVFHEFLRETAAKYNVSPELIGAKLMGRWASGAPIVACPERDDASWASNEYRRSNFDFGTDDFEPQARALRDDDYSDIQPAATDLDGIHCPFSSHIRKVFPRSESSRDLRDLDRSMVHTHRLLRRGIPYGVVSPSTPQAPVEDRVDRGLLFIAYQVSIEDQFEFVTKKFANDHNFNRHGTGYDPIIGQNDTLPNRWRPFKVHINGKTHTLSTYKEWVVPTGGGYFFAPSIKALYMLANPKTVEVDSGTGKRTKSLAK